MNRVATILLNKYCKISGIWRGFGVKYHQRRSIARRSACKLLLSLPEAVWETEH